MGGSHNVQLREGLSKYNKGITRKGKVILVISEKIMTKPGSK